MTQSSTDHLADIGDWVIYDPDTGLLRWKRDRSNVKAGSVAGNPVGNRGYVAFHFNSTKCYAHRVAWLLSHGALPDGDIDHINGDRSDNRLVNLRPATRSQNLQNSRSRGGASPYKGVSFHARLGRWCAKLNADHIGLYATEEEAARAYDYAAARTYGEYARLNFPEKSYA